MVRRATAHRQHWRWPQVLVLVVVMLGMVTYLNIAAHRHGNAQSQTAARLGALDLLLHEESELQWKTLADRTAPVRVAREVGTLRGRERTILAELTTLPADRRAALTTLISRYHAVLDRELALLAVGRTEEAARLEWQETDPAFETLRSTLSGLARQATDDAARANRTANLTLVVAMTLISIMIGTLLWRFDRAHRGAVRASADLLRQERDALQQARQSAATISHQATHDALTGLPNRVLFADRVGEALRRGDDPAVLFVDLDDFKRVNDSLGHAAGDEVLIAVADRLRASVRDADTAARLGGDEFAVLIRSDATVATRVADRLITALAEPVAAGGTWMQMRASIGIAIAGPQRDPAELLRNADVAMYAAKNLGKGQYATFDPSMHETVRNRVELEADLRAALDDDQLVLAYQPVVRLGDGSTAGAEALVRWRHPGRGLLGPGDFLPLAEASGLILPLGRWALREACRQAQQWIATGAVGAADRPFSISVNLSAHQLHDPAIVADVQDALRTSGLDPGALIVEITESAILQGHQSVAARLHAIRASGVRVALDDFGTGYSSMSHLQHLPVDQIKVDRSFVAADDEIAGAILRLGQALGMETVAEGIETAAQADRVRALGCELGQGYFFAKPLWAADFVRHRHHPGCPTLSALTDRPLLVHPPR